MHFLTLFTPRNWSQFLSQAHLGSDFIRGTNWSHLTREKEKEKQSEGK
jgi:hypothetical protein